VRACESWQLSTLACTHTIFISAINKTTYCVSCTYYDAQTHTHAHTVAETGEDIEKTLHLQCCEKVAVLPESLRALTGLKTAEGSAKSTIRGSQPKINKAILPDFKSATDALLCVQGKASRMFTRMLLRVRLLYGAYCTQSNLFFALLSTRRPMPCSANRGAKMKRQFLWRKLRVGESQFHVCQTRGRTSITLHQNTSAMK